jgi:sentrin-specific protease 1
MTQKYDPSLNPVNVNSSTISQDTPQQENGYDCGVFTCQFLEALSRGEEVFNFSQRNMPYLRRRMIWEVGHAKFLDGP